MMSPMSFDRSDFAVKKSVRSATRTIYRIHTREHDYQKLFEFVHSPVHGRHILQFHWFSDQIGRERAKETFFPSSKVTERPGTIDNYFVDFSDADRAWFELAAVIE